MSVMDKLTEHIVGALGHALDGKGPASVKVIGKDGKTVTAVVFIIPGPAGEIVDDALDRLYVALGWKMTRDGSGEVN